MKVSFGNTFNLYKTRNTFAENQQMITSHALKNGAEVKKVYAENEVDKKPMIDGFEAYYKDVITIKNDPELDNFVRDFCENYHKDYTETEE